jgi:hypothetical protein
MKKIIIDTDYKMSVTGDFIPMITSSYQVQNNEVHIEYSQDLAERIRGLYRLLDLCKDDGSNGLGTFNCKLILIKLLKHSIKC